MVSTDLGTFVWRCSWSFAGLFRAVVVGRCYIVSSSVLELACRLSTSFARVLNTPDTSTQSPHHDADNLLLATALTFYCDLIDVVHTDVTTDQQIV